MLALSLIWIALIGWLLWLSRAGLVVARMYQIEEYEAPRLWAWGQQQPWLLQRAIIAGVLVCLGVGVAWALFLPEQAELAPGIGGLLGVGMLHALWNWLPPKKALVYTPRMKRILGGAIALAVILVVGLGLILSIVPSFVAVILLAMILLAGPELVIGLLPVGNFVVSPIEASVRRKFIRMAGERINEYKPRVVGIAGSYGKTSTKHITAQLLQEQVNAFPTPKSFNTLLGVTRTINEYLKPEHRIFLVEMDAYGPGEIKSMVDLVHPQVAVLTSVGPQHLERFGTVDKIGDSLYELIDGLPQAAPAIIYAGDPHSERLAKRAEQAGYTVIRYGFAEEGQFDLVAQDIDVQPEATYFTWSWPARQLEKRVSIPLLGKHNILNTTAGLAVAVLLELDLEQAMSAARTLESVPHRLQRIVNPGGVVVIDDSYNANPVGVHNGLEALAMIQGRQKILVTPGMVELGSVQDQENERFGTHAAEVCSHVILVGQRQTLPIQRGLEQAGFAENSIHVVETLAEVQAILGQISGPGDVILFANDLPDTYLDR